jgi:hypothetical protein
MPREANEEFALKEEQGGHRGAPGPIVGGGLPFLVVGGAGFGVYWLVRRSRRKYS